MPPSLDDFFAHLESLRKVLRDMSSRVVPKYEPFPSKRLVIETGAPRLRKGSIIPASSGHQRFPDTEKLDDFAASESPLSFDGAAKTTKKNSLVDYLSLIQKHRFSTKQRRGDSVHRLLINWTQNSTDQANAIREESVRSTLLEDLEAQPLLAKTYGILFPTLINADLPDCKRWKDVLNATFRTLRNALKKVSSKQSRGPTTGVDCRTDDLGGGDRRMAGHPLRNEGAGRMAERPLRGEMDFNDLTDFPPPNIIGVVCRIDNLDNGAGRMTRRLDSLGNGVGRMSERPLRGDVDFIDYPSPNEEGWMDGLRQKGGQDGYTRRCQWQLRSPLLQLSPNIVSNGRSLFTSAIKFAAGMTVIGNTPTVGAVRAMAPEAAQPGSLQAGDFEKSSNFWFGVVACVGTLVTLMALLKSFNWRRRHSIAGTSAATAPAGAISNRAANMAQTLMVLRSWRETEYCEVLVARREDEGAHHREGLGAGPN